MLGIFKTLRGSALVACGLGLSLAIACGSDADPTPGGSAGEGGSAGHLGTAGSAAVAGGGSSAAGNGGVAGAAPLEEAGAGGEAGALADPDLESAAEQQAIIDRTRALPEPTGADPTADAIVAEVTAAANAPSADGAGGEGNPTSYYGCAQKGAAHAYPARRVAGESICDEQVSVGSLTTKLLVADKQDSLLIAFAGTQLSFSHPGDLGRDLESQAVIEHENPLFEHSDVDTSSLPVELVANTTGSVGRGWEARWRSQLKEANAANLYKVIKLLSSADTYAPANARTLTVTVVGHSLGAAVAELAAYDIYDYLLAKGIRFRVRVVAFNPPKLGTEAFVDGYRYRLLQGPEAPSFVLSQFSRSYDPVPKVPLLLSHPVWDTDVGSKVIGDGSDAVLPYCPQYALDVFHLVLAAHSIDGWATDIPAMPAEAQCLFGSQLEASDL